MKCPAWYRQWLQFFINKYRIIRNVWVFFKLCVYIFLNVLVNILSNVSVHTDRLKNSTQSGYFTLDLSILLRSTSNLTRICIFHTAVCNWLVAMSQKVNNCLTFHVFWDHSMTSSQSWWQHWRQNDTPTETKINSFIDLVMLRAQQRL